VELTEYLESSLDQIDSDALLSPDKDIPDIISRGTETNAAAARLLVDDLGDLAEFDDSDDSEACVTITMRDLFARGPDAEKRLVYYFRPIIFIAEEGRRIYVDGTLQDKADYTYSATEAKLIFTTQLASSVQEIQVQGHIVDWNKVMDLALGMLEGKILTSPDIYGSRRMEWLARVREYRQSEYRNRVG
jgi:hypothetical protein